MGRYLVHGMLGSGGMGTVLEAIDPGLDRPVALKVLHQELDARHTARLRREAQALAKLSHPNVIHVYEVGEVDGRTFVAMELVKGQTLRDWMLQEPKPSWQECVTVYLQAGEGLVAAHEKGLVHRDFKPANAIIDRKGRVRVLDFGLVRRIESAIEDDASGDGTIAAMLGSSALSEPLTRTGTILGTPAYMPPEQVRDGYADAHSDQFSYCVSLYEAVYGERPFEAKTLSALVVSIVKGDVRPAPKGSKVPARLRSVLLRGLSPQPQQRWDSMEVLLAELRSIVARRRRPWVALGLVGLVGATTAVGLGKWWAAEIATARPTNAQIEDVGATPVSPLLPGAREARLQHETAEVPSSAASAAETARSDVPTNAPSDDDDAEDPRPEVDTVLVADQKLAPATGERATKPKPKPKPKPEPEPTPSSSIHDSPDQPLDTLSSEAMQTALDDARKAARQCGKKLRTLMSEATVQLKVRPDGEVESLGVLPPAKGSPEATCIGDAIAQLRFPKSHKGGRAQWKLKLY